MSNKTFWNDINKILQKDITDPEILGELSGKNISNKKNIPADTVLEFDDTKNKKFYELLQLINSNTEDKNNRYDRIEKILLNPEIDGAMNIYADEATTQNEFGDIINVSCSDEKVVAIVTEMFERIGLADKAWSIIKGMCSYGDRFDEIIYQSDKKGIHSIRELDRKIVNRYEENNILKYFFISKENQNKSSASRFQFFHYDDFENDKFKILPYRILHWRLDNTKYDPYGQSIIDSVMSAIEELKLLQQSIILARVSRAPERRIYRINVGQQSGEKAVQAAKLIIENFKKKRIVDLTNSAQVNRETDVLTGSEEIVIPYRQGEEAHTIDTLPQLQNAGIEDVEFFRDRIFPGLGIPRQYLFDDQFANANTNLSNKSLPFAKRIQRVQRYFIQQLYKLAIIELELKGIKKKRYEDLVISMNNPSNLMEMQRLEIASNRWNLIQTIKANNTETIMIPDYWIYKNILNFSNEEILEVLLLGAVQKNNKNIFEYLPENRRPLGYEQLDEFLRQPSEGASEGDENISGGGEDIGGGMDTGGEDDIDAAVADLDSAAAEGGFEPQGGETPVEAPAPDTGTETPENASQEFTIDKKQQMYIESLKAIAKKRKNQFLKKQKELKIIEENMRRMFQEKEEKILKESKLTKVNYGIKYFENQNEFYGIEKLKKNSKLSVYSEDTLYTPSKNKTLTKKKK